MKIEVGKTYKDVDFKIVEIVACANKGIYGYEGVFVKDGYKFSRSYTLNGKCSINDGHCDLVEEIQKPQNNPEAVMPIEKHNSFDDLPRVEERYPKLFAGHQTFEGPTVTPIWDKPVETVNHPSHYGGKDNSYETIKVMKARLTREEYVGALKFNVYKYNDRAGKKGSAVEDHEKGLFYQTELVNFLRENPDL